MVLIGEYEHTSRDTAQACGIERHHSLRCKNAIVFLTHSDHDRSIPLVDEAVWRIGIAALCNGVFLIPECTAEVPICKPHLFGFEILGIYIEDTCVSKQGSEAVVVVSGKPIHRESAIACTGSTDMVGVDIGFLLHEIYRAEIVLHVLASIVARNLGIPLSAEAGKSATVGCDDYVALRSHKAKIPAIAPELADGALRSALAIENCRIALSGVEIGREYHPCGHHLAVGGRHKFFLHLDWLELREQFIVHLSEFHHFLARIDAEYFVRLAERVAQGHNFTIGSGNNSSEVVVAIGNLIDFV